MGKMIAVTDLSSYTYCKRKLFLEKVLGIRAEIPKSVLIKGIIRHKAFEKAVNSEEEIIRNIVKGDDLSGIIGKYKRMYSKILTDVIIKNKNKLKMIELPLANAFKEFWPALLTELSERAGIVCGFIEKNKIYGEELWEQLIPKLKTEHRIESEKLGLRGIIDRIEVYPEKLLPVEIKTGRSPKEGAWLGHKLQVGGYLLLLQECYGDSIKTGVIHYLDSKKRIPITLNPFLRDEILNIMDALQCMLAGKEIPEREENQNKCKACNLYGECYNDTLIRREAKKHAINY